MNNNTLQTTNNELQKGALSTALIIFFVISAASPLSVIAGGFPIGLMLGNGAGMPALLMITVAILLAFAVGYTTMAKHITSAGGFYSFTSHGLGTVMGGTVGVLTVFAYNILQIGLYGMFGAVMAHTMLELRINLPWWCYSYLAMLSIAIFGYRKIDLSAKLLLAVVIAEYLAILSLDFFILSKVHSTTGINLDSFKADHVFSGTPAIGLLFCFAAFIGFEATTIYSEEAKNPKRSIPIATYTALLLIGGFYTFSIWSLVLAMGSDNVVNMISALEDPTTLIYGISDSFAGNALTTLIRILFVISIYAGLLAFHNSAARYFYVMGRNNLFHARLGTTHSIFKSPHMGSLLQTAIAVGVVSLFAICKADPILQLFSWFSSLATLCIICLMTITSFAILVYFQRHKVEKNWLRIVLTPTIASVALVYIFFIAVNHFDVLTGSSQTISYSLTASIPVVIIIGLVLALRSRKKKFQLFQNYDPTYNNSI